MRRYRYVGVCFGPAGVGKTLSARRYARWDTCEPLLESWGPREDSDAKVYATLARTRTAFYTPPVAGSPKLLRDELFTLTARVDICIDQHLYPDRREARRRRPAIELVIVDEAERLSATGVEQLRDHFDRSSHGLILIGMPGIEKRLSRYPQLYSRIGFAHHYRTLSDDELSFVLTHHWKRLGLSVDLSDFTDTQAIATIARITAGNFRLLNRLFAQVERVMHINDLSVITSDVIEAASSTLVIGAT